MRLREDSNNWNSSNIKRKLAQLPDEPKHKSKKDKKRWCGGHVGREHELETIEHTILKHLSWKIVRCKKCGRKAIGGFTQTDYGRTQR